VGVVPPTLPRTEVQPLSEPDRALGSLGFKDKCRRLFSSNPWWSGKVWTRWFLPRCPTYEKASLARPTETSDATVAVAPDLCLPWAWSKGVGRRFLRTKCQGRGKLFLYLCKPQ